MLDEERIIAAISDVIQETYGDATQTVLDRKAARAIYQRITDMGMLPPSMLAAIVTAAGGKVTIPHHLLGDCPAEVEAVRVMDPPEVILRVRQPANAG